MTFLSEDPTYLLSGLVVLAVIFLVALRLSQQGKYLIYALVSLSLAALVVLVEWLWVTDNERIEQVVYDLRQQVLEANADGVLDHLAPNVQYVQGESALPSELTRTLIRSNLANMTFDFIRITQLQTSAMEQARRGTAEFRIFAKGTLKTAIGSANVGTANSEWSLGFRETEPGVWKVTRITPISVPDGVLSGTGGGSSRDTPISPPLPYDGKRYNDPSRDFRGTMPGTSKL
jgi:hypothetical protein